MDETRPSVIASKAEEGIARAVARADAAEPRWSELAFDFVMLFARSRQPFTSPQVRDYAEAHGLPEPTHKRAWGGPFMRASKRGAIKKTGRLQYGDNDMHHQPIHEWIGAN